MKRAPLLALGMLAALSLPGCPIYSDNSVGCYSDYDCPVGYLCDASSGTCRGRSSTAPGHDPCSHPEDCASGETCTQGGICQVGDCTTEGYGCVTGYVCDVADGVHACVGIDSGSSGAGGTGGVRTVVPGGGGSPSAGGGAGGAGGAG